jgi:hypothetical protein
LDLPKALPGGFAGGLFATFVPSPRKSESPTGDGPSPGAAAQDAPTASPVELTTAQTTVFGMVSLLFRVRY